MKNNCPFLKEYYDPCSGFVRMYCVLSDNNDSCPFYYHIKDKHCFYYFNTETYKSLEEFASEITFTEEVYQLVLRWKKHHDKLKSFNNLLNLQQNEQKN